MKNGYIKLYRSLCDNAIWRTETFTRGQAWVDMLLLASHTETFVRIRGVMVNLLPGQIAISEQEYAKRWKWSRGKVRRFLSDLESKTVHQIKQQKNNVTTVVSILNWPRYQDNGTTNSTTNGTTDGTTDGHIQECKECKEEHNNPPLPPTGGVDGAELFELPTENEPTPPKKKRHLTVGEKKKMRVGKNTPLMERLGNWFHRRPETLWTLAEAEALEMVNPSPEEVDLMERYYTGKVFGEDYRRRNLETLLNNWNGELDRARKATGKTERR